LGDDGVSVGVARGRAMCLDEAERYALVEPEVIADDG